MIAKLIINGVDFIPFLREGGVEQYPIVRQQVQVVYLGGKLVSRSLEKRGMNLSLLKLRDVHKDTVLGALSAASPAVVEYTDQSLGDRESRFYVRDVKSAVHHIEGGNTYWNNITATLEEE